jgi:hypothetical protein
MSDGDVACSRNSIALDALKSDVDVRVSPSVLAR